MNVVLDDAEEVNVKTHTKKPLGRILLKGDNITLIQSVATARAPAAAAAAATEPGTESAGGMEPEST